MTPQPRTAEYITAEESEIIACYRSLSQCAKVAFIALIASQIAVECQDCQVFNRLTLIVKENA